MDAALPVLLVLAALALVAVIFFLHFSRSRQLLESWARQNNYQIVSSEHRYFFKGPFFWTSSDQQTVYYVTVETADGGTRNGWVRCGGWFTGMLSDQVDVRWDE